MVTYGTYRTNGKAYAVLINNSRRGTEIVIANSDNTIESAYKIEIDTEYSYKNSTAKTLFSTINKGLRGCTSKNAVAQPFELGTMITHEVVKGKTEYRLSFYNNELCAAYINSEDINLDVYYNAEARIPVDIPYIQLLKIDKSIKNISEDDLAAIPVRSVEEIALDKEDTTWLANKKYFVVQDDDTAEQIFSFLDNYKGAIAYDVETTGLKVNMFGKIGSKYAETLEKYNNEHPDAKLRVDRLCGIIFCVEQDVSYYFPCFSRKYEVLYQNRDSAIRQRTVNNIKARYTVGDKRDDTGDEARYIRNTPGDQLREDVILMERVRDILEKLHIVSHGGSFEYKNGLIYDIDTNIEDDTMILHQVMYKFRSDIGGRGEPSNLKYLSKTELGIDQWSLKDFFPSITEKDSGKSRTSNVKNKASLIDFSYMDLRGTQVYAPADGDCTFGLFNKYKKDLVTTHAEQQYLYEFEMVVLLAIGYMEFYGHRINESKISNIRDDTVANIAKMESEIRQEIGYADSSELEIYNKLLELAKVKKEIERKRDSTGECTQADVDNASEELVKMAKELDKKMTADPEKIINLNSPKQVAELFYDTLGYPMGDKKSVGKSALKPLLREKNDDGSDKYPVVHMYSSYKKEVTLLTKFFDNLPEFMYPGGFIFSSYGQISTNTGRMSCSKPNAQQYPKSITKIVEPRPGFVECDADYSQIEYRVLTGMTGNGNLRALFSDPDSDYHTLMASLMYEKPYESVTPQMRSAAKSFNFGIPYGMGFKSLAILLDGNSSDAAVANAKEKYKMYFKNQPETEKYFADVKESASVNKYTKTLWNRYRWYKFESADGSTDNRKRAAALRQAGNAVIQGTAADVFKISVARQFMYIRTNKLFGKFLITNMIHDEQLMEIDVRYLNPQRILRDIGINMQFHIDGMPPLYIGAGFGKSWGTAKSKEAEIHPELLEELSMEAEKIPIFRDEPKMDIDPNEVVAYFDNRNYMFRKKKIIDYITNPNNYGKNLHPAIGSLINMQFSEGRKKEDYGDDDHAFLMANLEAFIEKNGLSIKAEWFVPNVDEVDQEEDDGYDDDEDAVEPIEDYDERNFTLIDDDKMFGADVVDLIKEFKVCVIKHAKVCGVYTAGISRDTLDAICDYLGEKSCNYDDDGAMQVIFVKGGSLVKRTNVFVKDLSSEELEQLYENKAKIKRMQEGDIETRAVR